VIYGFIIAIIIKGTRTRSSQTSLDSSPEDGLVSNSDDKKSLGDLTNNDVKKPIVPTIVVTDAA